VAHNELVPFQVTICGIDELAGHCAGGVTHILSILDPGWPEPEPLNIFDLDRRLKLRFHDVIEPHPGWIAPERWDVELLLAFGRDLVALRETHLLIHCHAGVSRSTAAAHYRRAIEREPWLAEAMIDGGRGREVAAAAKP